MIILLVIALDQVSKTLIRQSIPSTSEFPLIPGLLSLANVENEGVAFSFLSGVSPIFLVIMTLAMLALLLYWLSQSKNTLVIIGLSLAIGGTIGNLLDRLMIGGVIDFIHFYLFGWSMPIFNLADTSLFFGVCLVILAELLIEFKSDKKETG